ncbi:hypothetical protein P3G55_18625 [Leptospira sp. 96542]|nr:hypothetical protein [Leptospira sp. 96542]
MNREDLFGLDSGFISKQVVNLVCGFVQKKYSIGTHIPKLKSTPLKLLPGLDLVSDSGVNQIEKGLIIGSIRMGYAHLRIAASLHSHSLKNNSVTYLYDLLNTQSPESKAIADIENLYRYFSNLGSELGGPLEWVWGQMMSQGNLTSLELSCSLADLYKNTMADLPKDSPFISTYPLVGQIAVKNKFKHVVHLICDNFPQYYLLVPGALNLVQSPSAYTKFLQMGVPKENLAVAGHWVPENIMTSAVTDSEDRVRRIDAKKIRRFLLPMDGIYTQKKYIIELIHLTKYKLLDKKISYWICTNDHNTILSDLEKCLIVEKIPYLVVSSWEALKHFIQNHPLRSDELETSPPVVLFHFENHMETIVATEKLIRIADVLITKPSELTFYPIPKIFMRRVGDHEASSVVRSLELGEGSIECREPEHAKELIQIFSKSEDLLLRMNESVIKNTLEGVYNGCKVAVEMALSRDGGSEF